MNWTDNFILILLFTILGIAVITDLRYRKIPNWLTFSAMAMALIYHTSMNGWGKGLYSLMGIGLGMALLLIPYLLGGMGAGDVKLLGAVGGFLGPQGVFGAFIFIGIVGGFYALILLVIHRILKGTTNRYWMMLKSLLQTGRLIHIPSSPMESKPKLMYGLAIAIGTFLSLGLRNHFF